MAQFDVYSNTNPASKALYPFLIDVQSSLLENLETRLVIPIILQSRYGDKAIRNLTPGISIQNQEFFALTPQIAAVNKNKLGKIIENCKKSRNEIVASIDFLITGF